MAPSTTSRKMQGRQIQTMAAPNRCRVTLTTTHPPRRATSIPTTHPTPINTTTATISTTICIIRSNKSKCSSSSIYRVTSTTTKWLGTVTAEEGSGDTRDCFGHSVNRFEPTAVSVGVEEAGFPTRFVDNPTALLASTIHPSKLCACVQSITSCLHRLRRKKEGVWHIGKGTLPPPFSSLPFIRGGQKSIRPIWVRDDSVRGRSRRCGD